MAQKKSKKKKVGSMLGFWFLHRESEVSAYSDPKMVAQKKSKKKKVGPMLGFWFLHRESEVSAYSDPKSPLNPKELFRVLLPSGCNFF